MPREPFLEVVYFMISSLRNWNGLSAVALLCMAFPLQAAPAPDEPTVKIDKYLPDETGGVFVVDVKQILASKAFTKDLKKKVEDLLKMEQAQMVLKDSGFDPLKDIDRIVLAVTPGANGRSGPFFIVEGLFNAEKLAAKAEELGKQFPSIKAVEMGKAKVYAMSDAYVGLVDKNTVIISSVKEEMAEAIEKAGGKRKTELKSKSLAKLVAKMDAKQVVNVACAGEMATGGSATARPGGGVERKVHTLVDEGIESVTGGLTVGEDIRGKIVFTAKDAAAAKKIAAEFEEGLARAADEIAKAATIDKEFGPVVEVLKSIKATTNEQTITIEGQAVRRSWRRCSKLCCFDSSGQFRSGHLRVAAIRPTHVRAFAASH
jgi:hypothetical protein